MEIKLFDYFPELDAYQKEQIEALFPLYKDWNSKINVISRKDIDNLYTHHVQHSLAIAKFISFHPGALVLDLGTGGGFPGIPLAIMFPEVQFLLIDGTRKKLMVAQEVADAIGLKNIEVKHVRAENCKAKVDFVVSRAVGPIKELLQYARPLISTKSTHALPNGLITFKGGNIEKQLNALPPSEYFEIQPLVSFFEEEYFDEKFLVYIQG
jgi:16S rRNA (guanine527-N7)-methyltransferase